MEIYFLVLKNRSYVNWQTTSSRWFTGIGSRWCVFLACQPDIVCQLTQDLCFDTRKHRQWICKPTSDYITSKMRFCFSYPTAIILYNPNDTKKNFPYVWGSIPNHVLHRMDMYVFWYGQARTFVHTKRPPEWPEYYNLFGRTSSNLYSG